MSFLLFLMYFYLVKTLYTMYINDMECIISDTMKGIIGGNVISNLSLFFHSQDGRQMHFLF